MAVKVDDRWMIGTNQFFLQREGYNKIELGLKKDPIGSENVKHRGQWSRSSPPSPSMRVPPPPPVPPPPVPTIELESSTSSLNKNNPFFATITSL